MGEIDISESCLELKNFLQFNNDNSLDLCLTLEMESDARQNYLKLKQLIFVLEILEYFNYPITFVNFELVNNTKIKIIINKYSPLNSILKENKKIKRWGKLKNSIYVKLPFKLDNLSLIKFLSNIDNWGRNKKYLKDYLILIINRLEKKHEQTNFLKHKYAPRARIVTDQANIRELKVVIVLPNYTSESAGIRVLHRLASKLKMEGVTVYEILYDSSKGDTSGNLSIDTTNLGDFRNCLAIVPETIRNLPFKPRKTVQYFLNTSGALPTYSLGQFPVIFTKQFSYSSAIYPEMPRLFINVLHDKSFDLTLEPKTIDILVYFGKKSQFQRTSKQRVDIVKTLEKPFLEITRTFPDSNSIPLLLASSKNLISFDPLSAINHEASIYGCSTHIILHKSDVGMREKLEKYELNNPLIHVYSDISQIKLEINSDSDFQTHVSESIINKANEIEHKDFSEFLQTLIKMWN